MTTTIGVVPAWTSTELVMTEQQALELASMRLVGVEPVAEGRWRISTDSRVGVISGRGWELRIRPRLAIPKLLFLLAYSVRPEGWKDIESSFGEVDELLDALAGGFAWHTEQALERGILRGYVEIEERRNDLRGRVRFGDQLARSAGLPLPVELTYDDYTADVAENRILLTATEALLRLPRIPPTARRRLLRVRALLDDVEVIRDARAVSMPPITRLNSRYGPALTLAMLVLRARATALEVGAVSSTTFLFDMNEVFESFVFASLQDAFRRFGGRIVRHHRDWLDQERAIGLIPDITWWPTRAECGAVMDAKYKSLFDRRTMPNADAYQMLAYCIALGIRRGYLIYAKDAEERTRFHTIRRHGYEVDVRAIDVEREPIEILRQVAAIAELVATAGRRAAA